MHRVFLPLVVLFAAVAAQDGSQNRNIAFDLADLTVVVKTASGEAELEAFRSVSNDKVLNTPETNSPAKIARLSWVSIGKPTLVESAENSGSRFKVFQMRKRGFFALVQTLTQEQRQILAQAASRKYEVAIAPSQIVSVPLSKFECVINLDEGDERYIVKGRVNDFNHLPLRLDFEAPEGTRERKMFEQEMAGEDSIDLSCTIASSGKETKFNTLTITAKESQALGLTEKLFGPSHSIDKVVYVTREQMNLLSAEMYTYLSIVEEYEMPQFQFSETFVNEIIKQTAVSTFKQVPFEEALESLSKFATDTSEDFRPDIIKRDVGRILNVTKESDKSFISVNQEYVEKLQQVGSGSNSAKVKGKIPFLSIKSSVNSASSHKSDWSKGTKSLSEQLRELNSESQNEIEWEIDGQLVVPKSLNVAKLSRANFSHTLSFNRIRQQLFDAPFTRRFSLYSSVNSVLPQSSATVPIGTIISYAASGQLPNGWLFCNGTAVSRTRYALLFAAIGQRYGTGDGNYTFNLPDLRGRVALGVDATNLHVSSASTPGATGGNAVHKLTVAQLPAHAHASGNLITSTNGQHSHGINDPGHHHGHHPGSAKTGVVGSCVCRIGNSNPANAYTGISINHNGAHNHTISGNTEFTGKNAEFSLLQPYLALNYIIYAGL